MLYDYVALPDRPPLRWPDGARVAMIFTINIEYWENSGEWMPTTTRPRGPYSLCHPTNDGSVLTQLYQP